MANKAEASDSDISFFEFEKNKLYKQILNIEPNISKYLFLISTFLFLFQNTILQLPFLINNLFNPFMWILISIWVLILIVFPIWIHYLLTKRKLKVFLKSFEMIASLIIFITGFFIQFLPDIQFCAYTIFDIGCSTYPGGFLFGLIFIFILLIFSYPIISKFSKKKDLYNAIIDYHPIESKLSLRINDIKEKISQNAVNLNRSLEFFINSTQNSQRIDLYSQVDKYNDFIAQLHYFKDFLDFIQNDPKILDNRACYAYSQNLFELGIKLSLKSIKKSIMKNKIELMKRYHTLALNLTGIKSFENAFNVFKYILKNTRSLNLIDFDIFSIVLDNLNYHNAYNAVKQREFKSMFKILEIRYRLLIFIFEKVKLLLFILIITVSIIVMLNIFE